MPANIFNFISRSRKGAWIEIFAVADLVNMRAVAPARERGLKLALHLNDDALGGRSRKGAWIEIAVFSQ